MNRIAFAIFFCACIASDPAAAELQYITVQEGTNLKVSAPVTGDRIAFDLMGQIWVANRADGIGRTITDNGAVHRRPVFSPDGRKIASEILYNGLHHIALMDADGSEHRRVTFGDFDHRTPAWSPDSKKLIFSANRSGDYGIWELDIESGALAQLTFAPEDEWDPAWNSDGTKIVFVGGNANRSTLYSLRPGQSPTALLIEPNALYAPAWRPDDAVLTYVRPSSNGGALRMLILSNPVITKRITSAENVFPHPAQWTDAHTILYSADGHIKQRDFGSHYFRDVPFMATIAIDTDTNERVQRAAVSTPSDGFSARGVTGFSSLSDGRTIVSALGDLWEFDSDGALLRQLTNDAFVDGSPEVSTGGQQVAFISDRSGEPQLWIMELASGKAQQVTHSTGSKLHPRWNQDDSEIALFVADNSGKRLISVDVVSQAVTQVRGTLRALRELAPPVWSDGDVGTGAPAKPRTPPLISLAWTPAKNERRVIVRAGRIFDGIAPDYSLRREIVIEDGRIAAIRPWPDGSASPEDGAAFIDASAHTIIPGLIDLGTRQAATTRESDGRAWLAAGVTSIRQAISDVARAIEQRESWRSGRRAGPRLHFALRSCDAVIRDVLVDPSIPLPAHLAPLVAVETCAGSDAQQIQDTVVAAHQRGLAVTAPEPYPSMLLGIDEVPLTGRPQFGPGGARRSLAGAVYNDVIDLVADLQIGIVSNLSQHPAGSRRRQAEQQLFRILGRGGRVATGSGAPTHSERGAGLHEELQRLVTTGLQPFQVLKMATLEAARVLGREGEIGALRPGKTADLVIVDGDPLADITHAANVVSVVLGGQMFSQEMLMEPGLHVEAVGKLYN